MASPLTLRLDISTTIVVVDEIEGAVDSPELVSTFEYEITGAVEILTLDGILEVT